MKNKITIGIIFGIIIVILFVLYLTAGLGKRTPREEMLSCCQNLRDYLLSEGELSDSVSISGWTEGLSFDGRISWDGTKQVKVLDGSFGYDIVRNLSLNGVLDSSSLRVSMPLLGDTCYIYRYTEEPKGLLKDYFYSDYIDAVSSFLKITDGLDLSFIAGLACGSSMINTPDNIEITKEEGDSGESFLCFTLDLQDLYVLLKENGDFLNFAKYTNNPISNEELHKKKSSLKASGQVYARCTLEIGKELKGKVFPKSLTIDIPKGDFLSEGLTVILKYPEPSKANALGQPKNIRFIIKVSDNTIGDFSLCFLKERTIFNEFPIKKDIYSLKQEDLNEIESKAKENYIFYF